MYADETGNLDLSGGPGASAYFGIGTATFTGDHSHAIWEGLQLRFKLEKNGLALPKGFHAVNDSHTTRTEVFELIRSQGPRFDTTLLAKENAYPYVRAQGPDRIFKLAWYLHFKEVARRVTRPGDTLWVIAATLQTNKRKNAVREALVDVCRQGPSYCEIHLCLWDSATTWGLQVADYGLWAIQRKIERGHCHWWDCIEPTQGSTFRPWGAVRTST